MVVDEGQVEGCAERQSKEGRVRKKARQRCWVRIAEIKVKVILSLKLEQAFILPFRESAEERLCGVCLQF